MNGSVSFRASRKPQSLPRGLLIVVAVLSTLFLLTTLCSAGVRWTPEGVGVRTVSSDDAQLPQITSDGSGGAIITWEDDRSGNSDIYARKVDAGGNPQWTAEGVGIRTTSLNSAANPQITSDGSGGAIITWQDVRSGKWDIYAQKVDAGGNPQWTAEGVGIRTTSSNNASIPQIISDGSGGAIITWEDRRSGKSDIYARKVDAGGNPQWTAEGVGIRTTSLNDAEYPQITSDGSGGAIITWEDWRSLPYGEIYARKVDAGGNPQWTAEGVGIRTTSSNGAVSPQITSDGSGGAIINWGDGRSGKGDIYAQRVDAGGNPQWTAEGVGIRTTSPDDAYDTQITSDGSGGAIITWEDRRSGDYDIYARKVDAGGNPQWTAEGVGICTTLFSAYDPQITSDGSGGAIITWEDIRSGPDDIYAQRVDAGGNPQWTAEGVGIRTTSSNNAGSPQITSDGSGGAIITWEDGRSGKGDIYAQGLFPRNAPNVTGITPGSGNNNSAVSITNLAGTGFFDVGGTPVVKLKKTGQADITATSVNVASGSKITCKVNLNGAKTGKWDVYVRNPDGQTDTFQGGFTVEHPAPTVTGITPSSGTNDGTVSITNLKGTGFRNGAEVKLIGPSGSGEVGAGTIKATNVNVASGSKITCKFDLAGATAGSYKVKVENTDGKSGEKKGAFAVTEAGKPIWYLAEGTTDWGFDCHITIENPNNTDVTATITYMTDAGALPGGDIDLPAMSQATVNPADTLGAKDFSTKVECKEGKTIAVDRTMSWTGPGAPSPDGHCSIGVTSPDETWYLPEGSSDWGFECWLLIQNPNATEATAQVTYMTEGEGPQVFEKKIPAGSRRTYSMANDIGSKDASIKVEADVPVIPERAMYRNNRREGHDSIGTTSPATDYYLAEGTTDWGFTTYVLVQNPNPAPTDVTVTYMTSSGSVPQAPFSMPASSRKTIKVNDVLPASDFSTQVTGSQPIIAERAMYWGEGTAFGEACHDSIGMSAPHTTFYLPDGQTSEGRETYTLVQNPNDTDVTVEVTYLTPDGTGNQTFTETVAANSRKTFSMADKGIGGRAAVLVTSKTSGKKIMVERAMYWNERGAGTDTIGGYGD